MRSRGAWPPRSARRDLPGRNSTLAADARVELVRQLRRLLGQVAGERNGQRRPRRLGAAARDLAELLGAELAQRLCAQLERVECAHAQQLRVSTCCVTWSATYVAR